MTSFRLASLRPGAAATLLTIAICVGCATADVSPTSELAETTEPATPSPTPIATPEPTSTPEPTARFTNEPDEELNALFPDAVAGAPLVVMPTSEFALTPGDFGTAYGEIGTRFASLALAYIEQPRLSLYAARVDGEPVATEDLEPHLATAGRYVGIAGLDADAWELGEVDGTLVWMRGEDNATAAGTMIYTWSSGDFVFLLIGVNDETNRALVRALPGEPAPTPTPVPTRTPTGSPGPSPTGGSDG